MYKIAVMGEKDVVMGFMALGLEVFPQTDPEEAARVLHRLSRQQYAVVFITEELMGRMPEAVERYRAEPFPAVIPIPGNAGSNGLGLAQVRANVEKAIGADILFNEEE
ncbi:MAG: V-type ATP synthase subunit F [Christensenellales bacterium]|jgi:V/A-type H+-transporting ATPase subunit F